MTLLASQSLVTSQSQPILAHTILYPASTKFEESGVLSASEIVRDLSAVLTRSSHLSDTLSLNKVAEWTNAVGFPLVFGLPLSATDSGHETKS
jgi:hypothetical protein